MKLNGMGDHLVVPRTPSMNLKNGLSFSAWIRIEEPSQQGRLLTWNDDRSLIEIELDNVTLKARIVNGRKEIEVRAEDAPLSLGVWTHVAISADPQGQLTLYVNGQSAAAKRMPFGVPTPESDPIIGLRPVAKTSSSVISMKLIWLGFHVARPGSPRWSRGRGRMGCWFLTAISRKARVAMSRRSIC